MRKWIVFLLGAAFLLSHTLCVPALEIPENIPAPPVSINGFIVEETDTAVEVQSDTEDRTVILNLAGNPYVADAATGQPMSLKDRKSDAVVAYYGPAETRSIPPQSSAVLILCDVPEGYIPPHYGRAEALERTEDEVKVLTGGGSMIVTIRRDTPIAPFLTKNIVTIDNVELGSDLLMWYPVAALSFPGQALAEKTVILGKPRR